MAFTHRAASFQLSKPIASANSLPRGVYALQAAAETLKDIDVIKL
jgi:hypothetical protein